MWTPLVNDVLWMLPRLEVAMLNFQLKTLVEHYIAYILVFLEQITLFTLFCVIQYDKAHDTPTLSY